MPVNHHAEVIGSLLRPRYLSEAGTALEEGRITSSELKRIEDRAVDQAIAMQEGCGLDVVTDGNSGASRSSINCWTRWRGSAKFPAHPSSFAARAPTSAGSGTRRSPSRESSVPIG